MLPEFGRQVLVSDFDGTMAAGDFFEEAYRFTPDDMPDYWGEYQAGRMTHFEAMQAIYRCIQGGEQTLLEIAHSIRLDPQLSENVERLQRAGWSVVVVSAGCEWYIRRLFAERGVILPVYSNAGEPGANGGLEMSLKPDAPFFDPKVGVDKAGVVRRALETADAVAFAGDGMPDLPAARLVPAERRFARKWLAAALDREDLPYRPFERWSDVVEMLLKGA